VRLCFFFSSRRRHTRFSRDWSSDVCSSDLGIYLYKCTPHLPLGMVGVIQVGKPVNMDNVRLAADALSAGIAANKERLQKYLGQEIGRASCRERVWVWGGAELVRKRERRSRR